MPGQDHEHDFCMGETQNLDVAGICTRLSRFVTEALKCQSANVVHVMEADLKRLYSYLVGIETYKKWVIEQPQLDTPEFHPRKFTTQCAGLPKVDAVENESIKDWARLIYVLHYEMSNSQSGRMSTGLISHDAKRFDDVITKARALLKDYVEVILPVDLPETVPMRASVTAGNRGI